MIRQSLSSVGLLSFRCLIAVGFLLLLVLSPLILGADGDPPPKSMTIREHRIYELGDLVKEIREKSRAEVYLDRRHAKRRVFVSKGDYTFVELLEAVRSATGLTSREVSDLKFITERKTKFSSLNYPVLPKVTLDKIGKELRPLAEKTDLRAEGIPWPARDFLAGKVLPSDKLTAKEKQFLRREYEDYVESRGKRDGKTASPPLDKPVRLGVSYLIFFKVYTPAESATGSDGVNCQEIFQVYYDYRDRLGVELLDD
jgi:hypothetical protein